MKLVIRGNPDGTWLDLDQLRERLSYNPSKESLHFSIRALQGRELLEKKELELRRGQERRILAPTALGLKICART